MKPLAYLAAAIFVCGAAACSPPQAQDATIAAETACADGGARLPGTGICQGEAINLFAPERLTGLASRQGELPPGCKWLVNETLTPAPAEAIVYQALSCGDKTTKLEFSGGARSASLGYGVSGFFEQVPAQGEEGSEIVRLFPLAGVADPMAMVLEIALGAAKEEGVDAAEIAACALRAAPDLAPGAYLVDVNDAYKQANKLGPYDDGPADMPNYGVYGACGSFGVTDAADFWLIRDGYAWYVRQGQDIPDFDAGSLTVIRKSADGGWSPAT